CQPNGSSGITDDGLVTDSLTYRFDTIHRELSCPQNDGELCLQVDIVTLELTGNASQKVLKTINDQLETAITQTDNSERPASSPEAVADNLVVEYQRILKEISDYKMPWEVDQSFEVTLNQDGLFGAALNSYSFTGGAHGNYFTFYYLYATETGKRIALADLLKDGALEALSARAEQKFRKSYDIPDKMGLNDAGYWFENNTFTLPDNFKYSPEGLEFLYNTYEVAAYSEGALTILFDMGEVENLIRPEYRLIRNPGGSS
ncbi:MAG: DUF3298 and DUF4163 domain-containing protein, partial [Owenweeksia sp.]